MPGATTDDSELILWFGTDDLGQAELYVAQLAKAGIKAAIKPGGCDTCTNRYGVWLRKSDRTKADSRKQAYEQLQRELGSWPDPVPPGHPAFLSLLIGTIVCGIGVLSLFQYPVAALLLILVGIVIMVACRGLARFRQYQWIDLLALASFLPAAIGLTLTHYPNTWSARQAVLTGLIGITLVGWMGTVGALNRVFRHSLIARLTVWAPVCAALAVIWFVVLKVLYTP